MAGRQRGHWLAAAVLHCYIAGCVYRRSCSCSQHQRMPCSTCLPRLKLQALAAPWWRPRRGWTISGRTAPEPPSGQSLRLRPAQTPSSPAAPPLPRKSGERHGWQCQCAIGLLRVCARRPCGRYLCCTAGQSCWRAAVGGCASACAFASPCHASCYGPCHTGLMSTPAPRVPLLAGLATRRVTCSCAQAWRWPHRHHSQQLCWPRAKRDPAPSLAQQALLVWQWALFLACWRLRCWPAGCRCCAATTRPFPKRKPPPQMLGCFPAGELLLLLPLPGCRHRVASMLCTAWPRGHCLRLAPPLRHPAANQSTCPPSPLCSDGYAMAFFFGSTGELSITFLAASDATALLMGSAAQLFYEQLQAAYAGSRVTASTASWTAPAVGSSSR